MSLILRRLPTSAQGYKWTSDWDSIYSKIWHERAEKQLYAKELSEQHAKLAKLYKEQSVSKKREIIDDKQELINQAYSIIHAIEAKIQNIHDVIKKL
jgi:hypothetical protein